MILWDSPNFTKRSFNIFSLREAFQKAKVVTWWTLTTLTVRAIAGFQSETQPFVVIYMEHEGDIQVSWNSGETSHTHTAKHHDLTEFTTEIQPKVVICKKIKKTSVWTEVLERPLMCMSSRYDAWCVRLVTTVISQINFSLTYILLLNKIPPLPKKFGPY